MMMPSRVDYTSMEFGQAVPDRSGVIAICPKCGLNGLKQTSGSRDVVRYLHRTSNAPANSDETLQADFCFVVKS
jgi:hypothetical protein